LFLYATKNNATYKYSGSFFINSFLALDIVANNRILVYYQQYPKSLVLFIAKFYHNPLQKTLQIYNILFVTLA